MRAPCTERRARRIALALAVGTALAACASNNAPADFLPSPEQAQTSAYGGWIELTVAGGPQDSLIQGELIAVTADSVWVITWQGGFVLATADVKAGTLTAYRSNWGPLAAWAAVGTLSTASHGGFLIFTAPLWIIAGSVAASKQSRAPVHKVASWGWADLRTYARFPAGMPEDVKITDLRPWGGRR